jgi:ribonuclease/clavin/mitogillin
LILEPNNLLLSGDCILGLGTAVFDDLYTYMKSLSLLKTVCQSKEISCILPGHGPKVEDAVGKIEEYIKHRSLRESQILDLLKNRPGEWLTSLQVSHLVYGNIPIQNLASAQWNVLHHLQKLQVEQKIKHSFLDMWKIA